VLHGISHSTVVLAYSARDVMVVLANRNSHRRHGGSCACMGTVSRVVLPMSASGHHPCAGSRVWLMGELWLHRSWRGDVPSEQGFTAPGMAPQCWGWPHIAEDGRTGEEMAERTCFAYLASWRHPSHAPGQQSYTLPGCPHAFSRGSAWGKAGSRRHNALE
jgi:hypothetical protein